MGKEFSTSNSKIKPIIVTGFPYAFPYYFKVFEFLDNKEDFIFVLPKFWWAKKGKIQIRLEPKADFKVHGLKAFSYGGRSLLKGVFKGWMPGILFLLPYLKIKYKSKILYSCSEPHLLTTLYNGLIARFSGLKQILFTWQNIPPEQRMSGLKLWLSNALVRLNLKLSNGIICGNQKAEQIIKKFSPEIKTVVSPLSGVDIARFRPDIASDWKARLGISSKIILFYGVLDNRKGLGILIKAFSVVISGRQLSDAKLVIVGTGPEKERLISLVARLSLDRRVFFLDWMKNEELPALLNAADVFAYASVSRNGWEEQFGYSMAEASACGVPVVATQTGSISEVIKNGQSGILVEPNNPEQLAQALAKLLSDDNLRRQMGERGRKYVMENFSHQVVADKISNFLFEYIQ